MHRIIKVHITRTRTSKQWFAYVKLWIQLSTRLRLEWLLKRRCGMIAIDRCFYSSTNDFLLVKLSFVQYSFDGVAIDDVYNTLLCSAHYIFSALTNLYTWNASVDIGYRCWYLRCQQDDRTLLDTVIVWFKKKHGRSEGRFYESYHLLELSYITTEDWNYRKRRINFISLITLGVYIINGKTIFYSKVSLESKHSCNIWKKLKII